MYKTEKTLQKAFGLDENGWIDIPTKISNVKIGRMLMGRAMGCDYCFPHGCRMMKNARSKKRTRNWKNQRSTQWNPKTKK